ncbi:hypothetical protein AKJ51_02400 [candidate division MSBL1 archaeon SCGC-AAA382A20]|uniref:DUF559 domain-containing protein n=1 Tax=candidate division MSBL1 archaeon SCGC-AAA382A20 TaxID=1698280 RepID=A0A133VKL0_9EURY|nr:hypothetical protein AKJ51_02400 [candidate division MSBL1 archaeon SCGC-AAA382A20]
MGRHYNQRRQSSYRSRGERKIADFLTDTGLSFRYEAPLLVEDKGKPKIWYPDFKLPDYHMVIEYFGIRGDPGYRRMKDRKRKVYKANNIPAFLITPEDFERGWEDNLLEKIGGLLKRRACHFDRLQRSYRHSPKSSSDESKTGRKISAQRRV